MKILAIETSCDETAIALLDITGPKEKPDIKVLANSLLSQVELHQEYGGVYPSLAKREHEKNLPILLEKTFKAAGQSVDALLPQLDYIAVTQGPGLEPALWTGITFAEKLEEKWGIPVIPVNHMEGHIFSVLYGAKEPLELPAIALLASGGHTELVKINGFRDFEILGRTRDDAVGEAFDKVARMLGLPYPGGPEISRLAKQSRVKESLADSEYSDAGREQAAKLSFPRPYFPRPMLHSGDLDFSFSGLKTAVLYKIRDLDIGNEETKMEVARAFEDACVEVLVEKTRQALEKENGIKALILAGGVSANLHLRQKLSILAEEIGINFLLPDASLSTDNALMIGIAAFIKIKNEGEPVGSPSSPIQAKGNLSLED